MGWTLGRTTIVKHRLVLSPLDAPAIHSASYRAGSKQRELERREVAHTGKAGVDERAVMEWASPILFVPNKDNRLSFCADCSRLQSAVKRDSYSISRTDDCIDCLNEGNIFFKYL